MQFRQTWTLAALLLTVGLLTRRVAALDGTEKGFWDNHAVVVAGVRGAAGATTKAKASRVKISLLAVIETEFMVPTEIEVSYASMKPKLLAEHDNVYVLCLVRSGGEWLVAPEPIQFLTSTTAVAHARDGYFARLYK